jgi:hypothetical protein
MKTDKELIQEARRYISTIVNAPHKTEVDELFWQIKLLGGSLKVDCTHHSEGGLGEAPYILHSLPSNYPARDAIPAMVRKLNTLIGIPDYTQEQDPFTIGGLLAVLNEKYLGSDFDTFLEEEGILEHCTEAAIQRIDDWLVHHPVSDLKVKEALEQKVMAFYEKKGLLKLGETK